MEVKTKAYGKRVLERRQLSVLNQIRRILYSELSLPVQAAAIVTLFSDHRRELTSLETAI